jgi:NodT family efflux transporter outer membrane factor (OMF) lipoprotein
MNKPPFKETSMKRSPIPRLPEMAAACRAAAAAAMALGCASCNFAPKYERPPAAVPAAFKEAPAAADSDAAALRPSKPNDGAIRPKWWELYNDPVLNSLEEQVSVSNQTLLSSEANYRVSRALLVEARAALFPAVTTSPSVTRARSSATYSSSSGNASTAAVGGGGAPPGSIVNEYDLPFEATYTLDLWGRVRNSVAAARFSAQASAAELATATLSIQAQLADDYFQLRAVDEQRRILANTVASYRDTLALTQTLAKSGIDSDEDIATAQVQLDTVIAQATDVGVTRAQLEHAIAVLIGRPPAAVSVAPAPFSSSVPPIPAGIPSDLLERRPDIASAERQVAAANQNVGYARTAYFPSLNLAAEAGFETSKLAKLFDWPSRFWSVGPQLSGTLFAAGALRAANEQAEAEYDQAVANYRQAVLTAFQAVEDNLAGQRILAQEQQQQRTAVKSAERYLALTLTRYKAGIDSALNVATAQNTVLTSRETLVQVELREVDANIALVMALGGGWDTSQLPGTRSMVAREPKWSPAGKSGVPEAGPVQPPNPPAIEASGQSEH